MFTATEGYVREVISMFNESGFAALSPKRSGGRPSARSCARWAL